MLFGGSTFTTSMEVKTEPEVEVPTAKYTEYPLRSIGAYDLSERKHNVMKLATVGGKPIDLKEWKEPVKLNRKDPRIIQRKNEEAREALVKQRLRELAGKTEEEKVDLNGIDFNTSNEPTDQEKSRSNRFKKKTKRVFVASEESRLLQRQEYAPWVLEDASGDQRWIGSLEGDADVTKDTRAIPETSAGTKGWRPPALPSEGTSNSSTYVAFVLMDDCFQAVPVNRWYKFTSQPRYATLNAEEAEEEFNRMQKNTDDSRWSLHKRFAAAAAAAADSKSPSPKSERQGKDSGAFRSRLLGKSVAVAASKAAVQNATANKFRTVIGGTSTANKSGQDPENDEMEFEEDFADDDDGGAAIDDGLDEQEAKETEEKIKAEMRAVERGEAEEEEEKPELSAAGREMRKLMKKNDGSGLYDSDTSDEDNKYLSDSDIDDGASAGSRSSRHRSATPHKSHHRRSSNRNSRAGSPASGSAMLARRATSPETRRRADSRPGTSSGSKRQREDDTSSSKKRHQSVALSAEDRNNPNIITREQLIALLRTKPEWETRAVLSHFAAQIKVEPKNKAIIVPLIQSVSNLNGKVLTLKPDI